MKPLNKIGLIVMVVWLFIAVFGFVTLSYKAEFLLAVLIYLLIGGLIGFPATFL